MEEYECVLCGKITKDYQSHFKGSVIAGHCFSCSFWEKKYEELRTKQVVIVDGHYYVVGPNKEPSKFNGFGGRWFRWKLLGFPDKTFESCDMWHAGLIPEEFRDRLKDNAEWVEGHKKEWVKVGDVECLANI